MMSNRLRDLRKEKRLTLRDLAEKVNISYSNIAMIERGERNDSSTYLNMAKKWLEDDDIEVSPSEKLCIYYYDIVKGKRF